MPELKLFNTLTRSSQVFEPIVNQRVGLYACGPTVYDRASIGNLRAYVGVDILRRLLEQLGYKVNHVMNITDVGHLVGDMDMGEDKMEVAVKREQKTAWQIAEEYTKLFVDDIAKLNILAPETMPKATDHIAEQISMIQAIEAKGFTYKTSDGIYFDTAKLPTYGKLSRQKAEDKQAGARVEVNDEKHSPSDFALWKFSPEGEQRQMEWESPWGKGFPGWHIECSSMSEKYLGLPFDIHTGGIDHIAVHHENEIAQAQAARGVIEANFWLHNEFLLVDGGKMSKSLGNTYSLDDLEAKGISPLAFRYFILGAHYRSPLNFTWESAQAAQNALNNLIDVVRTWDKPTSSDKTLVSKFMSTVADDLDTPGALALLWKVVGDEGVASSVKAATVLEFDKVLGLKLADNVSRPLIIPTEVQALLDARMYAREAKDFAKSDELRDKIANLGFIVEDGQNGQSLRQNRGG